MSNELIAQANKYQQLLAENTKPIVVVLTGAGISAESGVPTFRDANGLWEGHDIYEVATPTGFRKNPELVLQFYNLRRTALAKVEPNAGHLALKKLEEKYCVIIVTQNVDDLHERAGSLHIIHLHGELRKVRSSQDPNEIIDIGYTELKLGELCSHGYQLRPHIVWFEEEVPFIELADGVAMKADYFMVIGTSMQVYPAAGLIHQVPNKSLKFIIDKTIPVVSKTIPNLFFIEQPATIGVPQVVSQLLER